MHIFLTEEEATLLLQAACENQITLASDIEKVTADPDFDKQDVYHFQAKHSRYEDLIRRVEHRLSFPKTQTSFDPSTVGDFTAWNKMPGGF
tara:strand:+ start:189 stop:461 length:273 start_codon:yes stop_codon:yes gene_type:complete